jgi:rhodanese-related sulfurtransferase
VEVVPQLNQVEFLRTGKFPSKLPSTETSNPKFITLDMRSPEEYAKGYVARAVNFPAHKIQNDLLFGPMGRYKNKPDVMIVCYMDDERHGTQAAKLIFEKGYDNVYLMSGGFTAFKKQFPDMVEKTQ